MDNGSALSASDVALLNNSNDGNNGVVNTSFFWIFALLILAGGGFGNGFGGNGGRATTVEDMNNGFNFNGVNNKLDNLTIGQATLSQTLGKGICDSTYETNMNIKDCCCSIKEAIAEAHHDSTMQQAQTQSMMAQFAFDAERNGYQREMREMQSQINQLQMQSVTCGIPKLNPYAWGVTPIDACHGNNYGGCCGY